MDDGDCNDGSCADIDHHITISAFVIPGAHSIWRTSSDQLVIALRRQYMDSCSCGVTLVVCLQGCLLAVLGWLVWPAPAAVQSMVDMENHTNLNLQQEAISIRAHQQKTLSGCWVAQRRPFLANVRATADESSSGLYTSPEGSAKQISISMQDHLASCSRSIFHALRSKFTRLGCNLSLLINNPPAICSYILGLRSLNLLSFSSPSPPPSSPAPIHPLHHTSLTATPAAASISRKLLGSPSRFDQTTARTDSLTLEPPDPPEPRVLPASKQASSTLHPPNAYNSTLPP